MTTTVGGGDAARWDVIEGDCVDVMTRMPDASVDAVVCDPPYGLEFMGKTWDRLGDVGQASHSGFADEKGFKGFRLASYSASANVKCGRCDRWKWDHDGRKCDCGPAAIWPNVKAVEGRRMQEWHERWAREALRVLKPGGFLLAFGGTRTYHRLACAVEDAGFEIRDRVLALGSEDGEAVWRVLDGELDWLYGSGFPKSLDVSKAIDKAVGVEGERGPMKRGGERLMRQAPGGARDGAGTWGDEVGRDAFTYVPGSDDAKAWEGWGTALKPAHEPIVVARKPLGGAIDVRAWIERGLRERGVEGEIRWTRRASDADSRSRMPTSGSTRQPPTAATSAATADGSEPPNTANATESSTESPIASGAKATESTPGHTAANTTGNYEPTSSLPTEASARAAASDSPSSSPSTTSTAVETPTGRQSTARSTPTSGETATRTDTASFAGIATGLTGSQALAHISRNESGAFEWPDDLPELVSAGSTVAQNVLAHGTGAMNIDGTRIASPDTEGVVWTRGGGSLNARGGPRGAQDGDGQQNAREQVEPHAAGRWPANTILVHSESCRRVGTRRVKGSGQHLPHHKRSTPGGNGTTLNPLPGVTGADHVDADGMEQVEAWECAENCPIAELDRQSAASGMHSAGSATDGSPNGNRPFEASSYAHHGRSGRVGDSGGASRFLYTAKSSAAERSAGLDGFEERVVHDGRQTPIDNPYLRAESQRRNTHPTVKPVAVMRWLVRLVTPPGGVVLDPFTGSGTTGIACALEGFRFVGVERDAEYVRIARARVAWWAEHGEDGLRITREREQREERAAAVRRERTDGGQLGLFGGGS